MYPMESKLGLDYLKKTLSSKSLLKARKYDFHYAGIRNESQGLAQTTQKTGAEHHQTNLPGLHPGIVRAPQDQMDLFFARHDSKPPDEVSADAPVPPEAPEVCPAAVQRSVTPHLVGRRWRPRSTKTGAQSMGLPDCRETARGGARGVQADIPYMECLGCIPRTQTDVLCNRKSIIFGMHELAVRATIRPVFLDSGCWNNLAKTIYYYSLPLDQLRSDIA